MMTYFKSVYVWGLLVVLLGAICIDAQAAKVTRLAGSIAVRPESAIGFQPLKDAMTLDAGGHVKTAIDGLARIQYDDDTEMTVRPNSEVVIGGVEDDGAQVRLGHVLIRASRLLESQASRTFRTPIAVAAIRGTEFGISVEPDGESSVYVFEGKVAVSNAQIPEREVLVGAGQMTIVRPLQPPTAPAPFQSQEFDQLGRLDALERGEDPILEASEEPASESYLAFTDPDIDALRNPAYMAESRGVRSTSVFSVHGLKSHERFVTGAVNRDATLFSGYGATGQHVTLLQTGKNGWFGVMATGNAGSEEGTVVKRTPFTVDPSQSQQTKDTRIGKIGGMIAGKINETALGLGVAYRRSQIDVDDAPADGSPAVKTNTSNRLLAIQGGAVFNPRDVRTFGIGFTHQLLKNTTNSGALHRTFTGYNHYWEALYRYPLGPYRMGTLLRVERTKTSEDVIDSGNPFYHEERSVWALKGGNGIGVMPSRNLVLGADLVGSMSRETATQFFPLGGVRENEKDTRFSATLHLGAQVYLARFLLLTFDVTHQALWQDMDFLLLPGTAQEREDETLITRLGTSAVTGIGILNDQFAVEYFISASGDNGRPLAHNLLLVVEF